MGVNAATTAEIEALYRARSHVFLYSVTAFLRDGEAALDVVQEGFAFALRRRESFRGEASLETWVWRIVLNAARDRQRALRRQPLPEAPGQIDEEAAEPVDDLRSALLSLPARQRLAVFLRGTVAASLHTAHAALRQQMEEVAG